MKEMKQIALDLQKSLQTIQNTESKEKEIEYYAHYDNKTGKILGFYNTDINDEIPEPNLKITRDEWLKAVAGVYNAVDTKNKKLTKKDFRTLDSLKGALISEVEDKYNKAVEAPITVKIGDKEYTFQADFKSQDILTKVIAAAPADFKTQWLDINNEPVDVTLDDLKMLANTILERGQQLFAKKTALKQQIRAAKTKTELKKITIDL